MEVSQLLINNPIFASEFSDIRFPNSEGSEAAETILVTAKALLKRRSFPLLISFLRGDQSDLNAEIEECKSLEDTLRFLRMSESNARDIRTQYEVAAPDGYAYLKTLSEYITKQINRTVVCICDNAHHRTIVVTSTWIYSSIYLFASLIPALLPWAFVEEPATEDEVDLLITMANPNSGHMAWTSKFEVLTEQWYGLKNRLLDKALGGFENATYDNLLVKYNSRIADLQSTLDSYIKGIKSYIKELDETRCILNSLENNRPQTGQLLEYFKGNSKLHLMDASDSSIVFVVCCYMDLFDPDVYQIIRENEQSYLYSGYSNGKQDGSLTKEELLTLLDGLFATERIKLKLCATWRLMTNGIDAISQSEYPLQFPDYLPNPHIQGYGCVGSFAQYLNGSIERGDYVMALDTACVDTGNVNLNDSVVTKSQFIPTIMNATGAIIELPDGTSVTTREAIKWLNEQEG